MIRQVRCALLALLLITLVPATGHAQLGGLKKKLKEKAGLEKTEEKAPPGHRVVPYKPGERIDFLTTESLEQFIEAAKAEMAYNALTPKERERADQQKVAREEAIAAKKERHSKCLGTIPVADMMQIQTQFQQRVMQLAQAGDPNPVGKATEEMQQAQSKLMDKKCGPDIKDEAADLRVDYQVREWICVYIAVREEVGPAAAAAAVLATESEVKMLEPHLAALQKICAG